MKSFMLLITYRLTFLCASADRCGFLSLSLSVSLPEHIYLSFPPARHDKEIDYLSFSCWINFGALLFGCFIDAVALILLVACHTFTSCSILIYLFNLTAIVCMQCSEMVCSQLIFDSHDVSKICSYTQWCMKRRRNQRKKTLSHTYHKMQHFLTRFFFTTIYRFLSIECQYKCRTKRSRLTNGEKESNRESWMRTKKHAQKLSDFKPSQSSDKVHWQNYTHDEREKNHFEKQMKTGLSEIPMQWAAEISFRYAKAHGFHIPLLFSPLSVAFSAITLFCYLYRMCSLVRLLALLHAYACFPSSSSSSFLLFRTCRAMQILFTAIAQNKGPYTLSPHTHLYVYILHTLKSSAIWRSWLTINQRMKNEPIFFEKKKFCYLTKRLRPKKKNNNHTTELWRIQKKPKKVYKQTKHEPSLRSTNGAH